MPSNTLDPVAADTNRSHGQTGGLGLLWPWYGVEMLGSYATTLITTGIYWYAAKILGAGDSALLWLSASFGYAYIVISMYSGKLIDRFGPRRVGLIGIGGCVVAGLLGALCTRWFGLIGCGIAMLLFNLTSTPCWPAVETAVAHTPSRLALHTRTGLYNILWSITSFLAFFTVGKIFEQGRFLMYFIGAGMALVGFVILLKFTRSVPRQKHQSAETVVEAEDSAVAPRAARLLLMAWMGNALAYVAIQTLVPMIPTLTGSVHLTTPAAGAAAASMWTFTRTLFFVLVMRWTRWHYSVRCLLGFQMLLVVCFFLTMRIDHLGLPSNAVLPAFLFLQMGFGAATAFVYSSSLYYAMHVSKGAGGHAGLHEALIGVGVAIGPTIGAIAGAGGGPGALPRVAWSVTAVLIVGTFIMLIMGWSAPRTIALGRARQG